MIVMISFTLEEEYIYKVIMMIMVVVVEGVDLINVH